MLSREVAMNCEEVDHGSQGEEVEIEEEGEEGCAEKEIRGAPLRTKEKVVRKEEERCAEESCGEEEGRTQEIRAEKARRAERARISTVGSASRGRSCGDGKPDHLSPVQPAGGRQSG